MAIDTALRSSTGGALVAGTSTPARLVPARSLDVVDLDKDAAGTAAPVAAPAPLRSNGSAAAIGSGLQNSRAPSRRSTTSSRSPASWKT